MSVKNLVSKCILTSDAGRWSLALIKRVVIVQLALIAALTIRFLYLYLGPGLRNPENHWEFVHFSVLAFGHALMPTVLVALLVFGLWQRIGFESRSFRWLGEDIVPLTIVFAIVAVLAAWVGPSYSFPRQTWLAAWAIAVAITSSISLSRFVDPQLRQRLAYNRTYYFAVDAIVVVQATAAAYFIRFDGVPSEHYGKQLLLIVPYVVIVYLGSNFAWGVYNFIWRFVGLREAVILGQAVTSAAFLLILLRILLLEQHTSVRVPYGVLFVQPILVYSALLGARVVRRLIYLYSTAARREKKVSQVTGRRVLLVGAGQAGQLLVRELQQAPDSGFKIIGFLDDDYQKKGRTINGINVVGTTGDLARVVKNQGVDQVILCMPTASKDLLRRIVTECRTLQVRTLTVPSLSEIILGKVAVGQLQPVKMEDLLGRPSVEHPADDSELVQVYHGRRILITGAGGSIGSELVRQLKDFQPSLLLLLDKDENSLYEIGLEVRETFSGAIEEVVANVRTVVRMDAVFSRWKPEIVFHAAAYKHVPMMEHHPAEAILNNVIGTRNLVELSEHYGVQSFVLISTDKAVNPTSIMGASKRLAEMVVQEVASAHRDTRFCSVRFGNVLGSRASVVPLFQKRIAQGKSIQVTHPEMRRYFMTIPEAVQLVVQAGSLGQHGEIFVLDMGDPVNIVDMARELIELSGLVPEDDIPIEFTGVRPGEKLFEELILTNERGVRSTKYTKILVVQSNDQIDSGFGKLIKSLENAARAEDAETIRQVLASMNIGYGKNRSLARSETELAGPDVTPSDWTH